MKPLRLTAEALACPWTSSEPFRRSLTCADFGLLGPLLHERLARLGATDLLREVFCATWPDTRRPLLDGLLKQASRLLCADPAPPSRTQVGQRFTLVVDPQDPGREILRWRLVSLLLPPGMLIAAAATDPPIAPLVPNVRVLPPDVTPTRPVAHIHFHIMAAGTFELLWAGLCSQRSRIRIAVAPAGFDTLEWRRLLCCAFVARRALEHLGRGAEADAPEVLEAFPGGLRASARAALSALLAGHAPTSLAAEEGQLLRAACFSPAAPRRTSRRPREVEEVWQRDPLYRGYDWPEGELLARCFRRLPDWRARTPGRTPDEERLLLQYLRVRCLLHAHLVADPTVRGFEGFQVVTGRYRPYRKPIESVLPRLVASENDLECRAVEPRTRPPGRRELSRLFREHQARRNDGVERGWVFHLIRSDAATRGPRHQYRRMERSARPLSRHLNMHPEALKIVRGIDVASTERDGPLWVAAPVLRRLRALSRQLAGRRGLPSLRLTVHAGEDFLHLATGLRSVDEPYLWGLLEVGDRLGHATALGQEALSWARRHPAVFMPRWERMLDLAWLIRFVTRDLGPAESAAASGILEHLREELAGLLRAVAAPEEPDVAEFVALHEQLGCAGGLGERLLQLPEHEAHGPRPTRLEALLDRYLDAFEQRALFPSDPVLRQALRRAGDPVSRLPPEPFGVIVEVPTALEAPLLASVQRALAHKVARRRTVIEVNPTSNLIIGGLEYPLEQSLLQLRPLEPRTDPPPLDVALNTDDSFVFSTCLADEYAYAWAGMTQAARLDPGYVRRWLDDAADASWRARFTAGGL